MPVPRMTTALLVSSLVRRAQQQGAAATILAHGDDMAGSLTLIARDRQGGSRLYTATSDIDGTPSWIELNAVPLDDTAVAERLMRLRTRDPDAWLVEFEISDLLSFLKGEPTP